MKKLNFKSILLAAVAVFGFGACAMAQTNYTINTTTTWTSAPSTPIGNITVTSGGSLTVSNCALQMDYSSTIYVINATLILENAQLATYTNQSGYLWNGIVLRGNCTIVMHDSQIKYAKTGILHVSGASTIQIDDSHFFDCAKGIEFNNFPYDPNSYIKGTTFDVAPSYYFGDFINNYSNEPFSCHISADNSCVPLIAGCRFMNSHNTILPFYYAINALNSDITVTCLNSMTSVFNNFYQAILSTDNYSHSLTVNGTEFLGNFTGITAWQIGYTRIFGCDISLGHFDDANHPYREGIVMNVCKHYDIMGNNIYKASGSSTLSDVGIYIKGDEYGLDGYSSHIYGNTTNRLTYGVLTTGNNLSSPLSGSTAGLEIYCNRISDCRYGIGNTGLIGNPQGSSTASAGNMFNSNGTDIYNNSAVTLIYYYDSAPLPSVYNVNLLSAPYNNCQAVSCLPCASKGTKSEKTFSEKTDENHIVSKYALVEMLKTEDDYESAEFELKQILYSGDLTENGHSEYETYKELFYLEKTMREQGRDWETMTADERTKLNRIAKRGYGRAQHMAAVIEEFYKISSPEIKQASFGWGEFPINCKKRWTVDSVSTVSDELKIVFTGDICSFSKDTVFVQGIHQPAPNEYPDGTLPSEYGQYNGLFFLGIYYSDSSMLCLNDKQCEAINLHITCESDFATGKHWLSECAGINYTEDSLAVFRVQQLLEFDTPYNDHGEGTVTITWTGFDGTPRQHVLYFIIDDHFYIDFLGLEENENVSASGVRIFPNPTDGTFAIEAENITNVEIFDLAGQKVLTDNSGNQTINAGSLPAGVYLLKVETVTGTKYGKLMRR